MAPLAALSREGFHVADSHGSGSGSGSGSRLPLALALALRPPCCDALLSLWDYVPKSAPYSTSRPVLLQQQNNN